MMENGKEGAIRRDIIKGRIYSLYITNRELSDDGRFSSEQNQKIGLQMIDDLKILVKELEDEQGFWFIEHLDDIPRAEIEKWEIE